MLLLTNSENKLLKVERSSANYDVKAYAERDNMNIKEIQYDPGTYRIQEVNDLLNDGYHLMGVIDDEWLLEFKFHKNQGLQGTQDYINSFYNNDQFMYIQNDSLFTVVDYPDMDDFFNHMRKMIEEEYGFQTLVLEDAYGNESQLPKENQVFIVIHNEEE